MRKLFHEGVEELRGKLREFNENRNKERFSPDNLNSEGKELFKKIHLYERSIPGFDGQKVLEEMSNGGGDDPLKVHEKLTGQKVFEKADSISLRESLSSYMKEATRLSEIEAEEQRQIQQEVQAQKEPEIEEPKEVSLDRYQEFLERFQDE